MRSLWLTAILTVLLAVVLGMTSVMTTDPAVPNFEFLPEMKHSPAADALTPNSQFANGRTQQMPVPNTIPRGDLPLYYTASKEDAARAGEELKNPFVMAMEEAQEADAATDEPSESDEPQDNATPSEGDEQNSESTEDKVISKVEIAETEYRSSIARGEEVFRAYCICCHGPQGAGDGPVAKRGFPPPPPLPGGKSTQMKDGQLFHILTYGQGSMAPMNAQLSREQRWDVINFVRDLQARSKQPSDAEAPFDPAETGDESEDGGQEP